MTIKTGALWVPLKLLGATFHSGNVVFPTCEIASKVSGLNLGLPEARTPLLPFNLTTTDLAAICATCMSLALVMAESGPPQPIMFR